MADNGSEAAKSKKDLKDKVKQMVADGGLTATLGEWIEHVRLYGTLASTPICSGTSRWRKRRDVALLT